ncbi:MAG: GlsB/YeaQ/YmgE family stress response membrane protein [Actinobacteria bacterium]|nr:GlsB/YeaQ/YmgE family stress response membrane protein [Actinomycetota bacterium]
MSWFSWIVIGFLAGCGAKAVTANQRPGCLGTILVGIVGGLLGGALFNAAGDEGISDFSIRSLLVAFVGAAVLLFAWNLLTRNERA